MSAFNKLYGQLALVAFAICFPGAAIGTCDEPTITVGGEAEVLVVPDQVAITIGIESRAKTVTAAAEDNDAKIRDILDFIKAAGIADKDTRTDYISIDPLMENANGNLSKQSKQQSIALQPAGFVATRMITITLADLEKFEAFYKGLVERGINRVRGIEFRSSEMKKHRDAARLDAVRNAREKAKAMAGELGATLASVKTIRETRSGTTYGSYGGYSPADDPFGAPPSVAPALAVGQIPITASVEIVFILGETELPE